MVRIQLNKAATPTPERSGSTGFPQTAWSGASAEKQFKSRVKLVSDRISRKEADGLKDAIKSNWEITNPISRMGLLYGTIPPVVPCPLMMDYHFDFTNKFWSISK